MEHCPVCSSEAVGGSYVVHLKIGALVEHSGWCHECLLPSLSIYQIDGRCEHGWPVCSAIGQIAVCTETMSVVRI